MITTDDVVGYFEAMHGHPPFPWQLQLAEAALEGRWPEAVDAPTGLGKTWAIDIALLVMAAAGHRGDRSVFRRIFFVVDRRTVVDEAWRHTRHVAAMLRTAESGTVLHAVAEGLRALIGESAPDPVVGVVRMRGGTTWESLWAQRPDQPLVVLTTVDQIGSRLLFRGYGVSNAMRPLHAALVGCHSMMILDEVHLARPFAELVERVRGPESGGEMVLPRLRTLSLSATPGASSSRTLVFDEAAHLADEEAGKRLASDKRLAMLPAGGGSQRIKSIVGLAREIMAVKESRLLVVCNTVASARTVHEALVAAGVSAGLLTGRSRPYDRQDVEREWLTLLRGSVAPAGGAVLVATQTVEVGVNLDVDWLITEECALNALIQRLGRVNRFGNRQGAAIVVSGGGDDPVYGATAGATTTWLRDRGAPELRRPKDVGGDRSSWLDVSPMALRHAVANTRAEEAKALAPPPVASPMIDASVFRSWAQTSPPPLVDVPIEQFLHGSSAADTTVAVAWRANLGDHAETGPLVVPISAAETVEVPLASLRAFLASAGGGLVADVESGQQLEADAPPRAVARLSSDGGIEWTSTAQLRAGDTVVLPTERGGLDAWGWAPASAAPTLDVSPMVERRGRQLILLDSRVIRPLIQGTRPIAGYPPAHEAAWSEAARLISRLADPDAEPPEHALSALRELLRAAAQDRIDTRVKRMVDRLESGKLVGRVLLLEAEHDGDLEDGSPEEQPSLVVAAPEDDLEGSTASLGRRVSLTDHGRAVGARAKEFASALGLAHPLAAAVTRAAEWHDLGKIDPRFQAQLWGGTRPHAGVTLLAKSGIPSRSPQWHAARRQSRYPSGMRHEALSAKLVRARLAMDDAGLSDGVDVALLVHLVAAHHGRARPLSNTVDDPDPQKVRWHEGRHSVEATSEVVDDLAQIDEFDRLNDKYGLWGLALLETVVRLADIGCSREGS